jgi:hypothetical protein
LTSRHREGIKKRRTRRDKREETEQGVRSRRKEEDRLLVTGLLRERESGRGGDDHQSVVVSVVGGMIV